VEFYAVGVGYCETVDYSPSAEFVKPKICDDGTHFSRRTSEKFSHNIAHYDAHRWLLYLHGIHSFKTVLTMRRFMSSKIDFFGTSFSLN